MNTTNPLLDFSALPRFDAVLPEQVEPAIDVLLADASAALELAVAAGTSADYDTLASVLDVPVERLNRAWNVVGHLQSVVDTPALRAAYNAALPKVSAFHTRLGADERLFAKYRAVAGSPNVPVAGTARRRALDNALRDFRLSGAELEGEAKARFQANQEEEDALAQKFSENVLDATDAFAHWATPAQLDGLPADVLAATQVDAEAAAGAPAGAVHKLTLQFPCYLPVMQYVRDRAVREAMFRGFATRASELGAAERDNTATMRRLLEIRAEQARLLGEPNYAALSLVPKMAESPEQVMAFLRDLARRARPAGERDLAELREFARAELGLPDLQPWDLLFAAERLKEKRYAYSEQDVKRCLTEPKVLDGLFRIVETLFEVQIRPDTAPVWHDSVRFYRIERTAAVPGAAPTLVAQFYLDPYARPGKRQGAWMSEVRSRWARPDDGTLQTPVAHLVCNFAAPLPGQPALLMHRDLITLFHEFGHGLHHMLTRVDDLGVSGIAGVEWDAVELPSQFMENFCWEWSVLERLTADVETGAPMPRALFDKLLAAKNFHTGLATLRQVEFALVDMTLHHRADAPQAIAEIAEAVRREVAVVPAAPFQRTLHAFSHIFAGGYSAGYYSYKWAEVLSADAWSAFEEAPAGALDVPTGRRYREAVLEAGGSRTAMENFKAFRGREPTIDALLRHHGLVAA